MLIKVKVINNPVKFEEKFPLLLISKLDKTIILATERQEKQYIGTIISSTGHGRNQIGEFFTTWNADFFIPFHGKVILETTSNNINELTTETDKKDLNNGIYITVLKWIQSNNDLKRFTSLKDVHNLVNSITTLLK
jgi:hypothetical protein